MEYILTERITQTLWRLRRIPNIECELINRFNEDQKDETEADNRKAQRHYDHLYASQKKRTKPPIPDIPEDLSPATILAIYFEDDEDKTNPFTRLSRYETHLQRSYHRDQKLLTQLQKDRIKSPRLQEDSSSSPSQEFPNQPTPHPQEQLNQIFPDHPLPQDQTPQIQKVQNEANTPTHPPQTSNNQPPITNTMIQKKPNPT